MKKVISIIAGLFLISTLSACSSLSADSCGEGYYKSNGGNCIRSDMPPTWGTDEWVEPVDTSWIPSDFNGYTEDSNIAWRWAKGNEFDCEYGSCWGIMILAKDGCSSMYAEINIFDKNDIQIDYTNELTSIIQPMQKVLLSFSTFNDSAQSASVAEFNCR